MNKSILRHITLSLLIFSITAGPLSIHNAHSQSLFLNPEYLGMIQQKVNSCVIYPQEARAKGWEGMVKIRFTLVQGGRIKEIDVAESSGYPLLDAVAMLAVKDASPYPLPQGYTKEVEIIVPINYKQDKPLETSKPPERVVLQEDLSYFVDLAIKNNQPLKVARQEIELAQFKLIENQRNLFPNLKISGYSTEGDVYNVDYKEWESRVEVSQPLFRGGQLVDAVRQAKVELEITQKDFERLKLELMQKTETAYYNLAAAKMHLKLKGDLLKETQETLEKIEKLSAAGMVIPLELNSARAWFEQIQLQTDTIKQEVLMAELALKQVLNAKKIPAIEIPELWEPKKLNIDLSTCMETALVKHPEIQLSELLVKYRDYSQKMRRSEVNTFSVDLTSSYGYYKGHYTSQPWEDTDNWFAGIKVTKPWGGSTLSTSYNANKTTARFGESSPSRYKLVSADFAVLDNLKRLSDKKRADIDIYRSLSDFNETAKSITYEVQDAFLNYQKAILQLNTAQTQMKFRRNETDVIKIRAMVGEANLSSALESVYNLSDAQARYIQALIDYQTSLVNLKKATGYGIPI